jgi:hypothetical protein
MQQAREEKKSLCNSCDESKVPSGDIYINDAIADHRGGYR